MKVEILTVLVSNNGIPEKERSLLMAVRLMHGGTFTEADFKLEIEQLEAQGLIVGVTNTLDQQRRWSITDKGKIALASL